MKLFIKDRIYLLNILPNKALNYKAYNLKKDFIKQISISEDDKEKYQIKTTKDEAGNDSLNWNVDEDIKYPIEVEMTKDLAEYLKTACESISDEEHTDDVWNTIERMFDECSSILN